MAFYGKDELVVRLYRGIVGAESVRLKGGHRSGKQISSAWRLLKLILLVIVTLPLAPLLVAFLVGAALCLKAGTWFIDKLFCFTDAIRALRERG